MSDVNMLQLIAGTVESIADHADVLISISLSVNGTIIEGNLISAQQFYAEHAQRLASTGSAFEGVLAKVFDSVRELEADELATNIARSAPELRGIGEPPTSTTYLHVITKANGERRLWQVRIDSVDAWSLGPVLMA